MSWRFVRQPNGLFARYSEISDGFTHLNLTTEAAILYCTECARMNLEEADDKVKRALLDVTSDEEHVTSRGTGLNRWNECVEILLELYGAPGDTVVDVVSAIEKDNGVSVTLPPISIKP